MDGPQHQTGRAVRLTTNTRGALRGGALRDEMRQFKARCYARERGGWCVVTSYELICGAVEERGGVSIFHEHGTYHIRSRRWREELPVIQSWWRCSPTLREARRHAAEIRREMRQFEAR
jgi:hypothetical protein